MVDKPTEHELRTQYLSTRDISCPNCGYALRGLTRDRCPECNQRLELAIRLADQDAAPYIVALVALSAGAGAGALILALALTATFSFQYWQRAPYYVLPAAALALEGSAAIWLIRRRGRMWFRGLTNAGRRLVVTWSCIVTLGFFGGFLAYCVHNDFN